MKVSSTVLLLGATVRKAMAAPTYYTDRAAFNTAAGSGRSFESFEAAFTPAASHNFGDFTFTETSGRFNNVQQNNPDNYDVATDGTYTLVFKDDIDDSIGTFSFSDPINAFAVDIIFSSSTGLTIGGDVSQSISMTALTPKFWGVIDPDGITDLTFAANGVSSIFFDSLSYVLRSEQPSSIPSEAPSVSGVPSTEVSNYPTTYIVM